MVDIPENQTQWNQFMNNKRKTAFTLFHIMNVLFFFKL